MNQPLSSIMSEDWAAALAPVEEQIHAMGAFLREEHAAGYRTFPPAADIFNAFRRDERGEGPHYWSGPLPYSGQCDGSVVLGAPRYAVASFAEQYLQGAAGRFGYRPG